jgi:hypothetical protein
MGLTIEKPAHFGKPGLALQIHRETVIIAFGLLMLFISVSQHPLAETTLVCHFIGSRRVRL